MDFSSAQRDVLCRALAGPYHLTVDASAESVLVVLQLYHAGYLEPIDFDALSGPLKWSLTQRGRQLLRRRSFGDSEVL